MSLSFNQSHDPPYVARQSRSQSVTHMSYHQHLVHTSNQRSNGTVCSYSSRYPLATLRGSDGQWQKPFTIHESCVRCTLSARWQLATFPPVHIELWHRRVYRTHRSHPVGIRGSPVASRAGSVRVALQSCMWWVGTPSPNDRVVHIVCTEYVCTVCCST